MKKIFWLFSALALVVVVIIFWCSPTNPLSAETRTGEKHTIEALRAHGFGSIQIIGCKKMTIFTKRARITGIEFSIVAVKEGKKSEFAAFYRPIDKSMMFFKGEERIFLD